jgi:hypothetical protein
MLRIWVYLTWVRIHELGEPSQGCGSGAAWIRIILRSWIRIRIRIRVKSWFGSESALKSKFRSFKGLTWSCGGPWMLTIESYWLEMKTWRFCSWWSQTRIPLMISMIRIRSRIEVKSRIRIRLKVMGFRNPGNPNAHNVFSAANGKRIA